MSETAGKDAPHVGHDVVGGLAEQRPEHDAQGEPLHLLAEVDDGSSGDVPLADDPLDLVDHEVGVAVDGRPW